MSAAAFYQQRLEQLKDERKKLLRKKRVLGTLRFSSIAALIAVFYFLWSAGWVYVASGAVVLLTVFTRLIFRDLANRSAIEHLVQLIKINEEELTALSGNYYHFADGSELSISKEHPYANDLDVFGHASLFQFINRTSSEMGTTTLADWLLTPDTVDHILEKQEAIKELSAKQEWRQHLQAYGKEKTIRIATLSRLQYWLTQPTAFLQFKSWQWLRYLLPCLIIAVCVAAYFDTVSMNFLYGALFLFAALAYQINKVVAPIHEQLSKMVDELDALSQSIAVIEKENFNAPLLRQLKENFAEKTGTASGRLKQLKKMLDRLDMRYNIVVSAPLNLLLLWNLQQVLDLEQWKKQYSSSINSWFSALGEFEALNSFANLAFNNEDWTFPSFKQAHFFMEGKDIGHPLINKNKRVDNFIKIDHRAELMLVTGSNMAGKSTYLRSIGINTILAMTGAPVCASYFCLSPVQVISSMRIADNLEESTSTFYAELKKLKTVIDSVNKGETVFILLDEILRGTNSLDRHTGSVALIKQLIKHEAAAIIATHDVELAKLQETYPANIINYHFDVQVSNDELYFDYKLKEGVCTSLNASILMKKIGIEL